MHKEVPRSLEKVILRCQHKIFSAFRHSTESCVRVGAANVGSCEIKDFVFEDAVVMLAALSHFHVPLFAHIITS